MKLKYGTIEELKRDTEISPHVFVVIAKADVLALIEEVQKRDPGLRIQIDTMTALSAAREKQFAECREARDRNAREIKRLQGLLTQLQLDGRKNRRDRRAAEQ